MSSKTIQQSPFHKRSAAFSLKRDNRQIAFPINGSCLDWNAPVSLLKVLQAGIPPESMKGTPAGIYFLIEGFEVIYVGRSVNIPARIDEHLADPGMLFSELAIMPCPENAAGYLETWFIASFQPKLNRTPKRTEIANVHRAIVGYSQMENMSLRLQSTVRNAIGSQ